MQAVLIIIAAAFIFCAVEFGIHYKKNKDEMIFNTPIEEIFKID